MQIHKRYTKFVLRLNTPLYTTTAIISQSEAHATSIPKQQAMEYFKSAHHVCKLCTCIEVQYLQTCSYTENIPPNLWKFKQCVHKLNSRYYELARKQCLLTTHAPRTAKYSLSNSFKSLVSRMQNRSQVPT